MLSTEVTQLFLLVTAVLIVSQLSTILSFRYFTAKKAFMGILLLIFGFGSNFILLVPILFGRLI